MEAPPQTTEDIPSTKQVFVPEETRDHPFDLILVVEDGTEFKAHRRVLSEASPFFETLLKSDMREANEGVVRLEMLTELGLGGILEFIYTGSVQVWDEENAQELIAMADYLFLPRLGTLAEKVLVQTLNASNSIPTYYFAEKYRCEELISGTKSFILANFVTVAKTEDFLNLSINEVKMWISSDEISVSAEEDVFKIILTWINREKSERKKYFAELFHEVRLVYVSRDFLHSDIVTNDLVNSNEGCMDPVKQDLDVNPRRSLETPLLLICTRNMRDTPEYYPICYYHLREDKWCRFPGKIMPILNKVSVSCRGKLFVFFPFYGTCYGSFLNRWSLRFYGEQSRILHQWFVRNDDEMYALTSEGESSCPETESSSLRPRGHNSKLSFITKFTPESNSWEDISSFNLGSREGICVVIKDNFFYFLGGNVPVNRQRRFLTDVDRYDLSSDTWDKIADLQEPRGYASGAAAYGKIFVVGGGIKEFSFGVGLILEDIPLDGSGMLKTCEVFDEASNEWHYIANTRVSHGTNVFVDHDQKLCVFGRCVTRSSRNDRKSRLIIECYDPDKNEWYKKTEIPPELMPLPNIHLRNWFCCFSMNVFKEHYCFFQDVCGSLQAVRRKRKCAIA